MAALTRETFADLGAITDYEGLLRMLEPRMVTS